MPERHHGQMNKFIDFPLPLYILGLFLLFLGIAAQAYVAITDKIWTAPPPEWQSLRFIYWDIYEPDLQTELQNVLGPPNSSPRVGNWEDTHVTQLRDKMVAVGLKPQTLQKIDQREFRNDVGKDIVFDFLKDKGIEQRLTWATRVNLTAIDYLTSKKRLAAFERALDKPKDPLFLSSREKVKEEKLVHDALKMKMVKSNINPAKEGFVWMILVCLLVLGIFLASSFFLSSSSRAHISQDIDLKASWIIPYGFFLLFFFVSHTGVVIYTSILKTEKYWIGASSFFVSPSAWFFERVAFLGLSIIMAIPATQLWCYLREEYIPQIPGSWLRAPDQYLTIERYVLFLQTWTLVIFGGFAVITIGAIRWAASQQEQFENAYLFLTAAGIGFAGCLILKMIRNAIVLRGRYRDSLSSSFTSWGQLRGADVPPDPTKDFIGESWWKLPLNFTGIVTATWAVLEWSGVSTVILNALK